MSNLIKTELTEISRESHNHKLQATHDTNRKRNKTDINAYEINKCTTSISSSSELITMLNRTEINTKNKIRLHKATQNKNHIRNTSLESPVA